MNNYWAFAQMTASNDLVGDAEALQRRMDADGYLYFERLIDPDRLAVLRREMLMVLADNGWISGGDELDCARCLRAHVREGDDEFFAVYDEIQKLKAFHTLAHDRDLLEVMGEIVGETAFPHPLKVARLSFPTSPYVSTPPHQDYLNNQGTQSLTAAWIPVGDCPMSQGTLAVLRGSHRRGVLPLKFHVGAGNRQAMLPPEMIDDLTWVTADMSAGDVLLFGALTVHAALHNATRSMRLSVDFRFQPEKEVLTDLVLEPHFQRLSWEQVYAGWQSDEFKYYWRDLDYQVAEYDRSVFGAEITKDDYAEVTRYEQARRKEEADFAARSRPTS